MLSLYTGSSGPWGRRLTPVSFSMKRLGVLLLPPGWDASPLQGYPQHICWYPFVHLGEEKHCESKVSCLINNTTQWLRPGLELRPLDPESSALTMRPLHLHTFNKKKNLIMKKKNTLTWSFRGQQLPKSEDNCSFIVPDYLQEKSLILI